MNKIIELAAQKLITILLKQDSINEWIAQKLDAFKVSSPKIAAIVYAALVALFTLAQQAISQNWIDGSNFWIAQAIQMFSVVIAALVNSPTFNFKSVKLEEEKLATEMVIEDIQIEAQLPVENPFIYKK